MKKVFVNFSVILICLIFLLGTTGCGSNKVIDNVEYGTHGLFNKDEEKNPDIKYKLIWGNIVWGAFLCETIIAPIYFYGFSMWEPVGKNPGIKG